MGGWRLVLAVVLLGARPASAQIDETSFTVSGYIADAETGESLAGANVFVAGGRTGTVSNEFGYYSLTLPPGRIVLRVSFLGYAAKNIPVLLQKDLRLDIEMEASAVGMDEVFVEAERDGIDAVSSRMSTVLLPIEEVERLPAFLGETDIIKAIQLLPGVQSGTEGTTGLYVRGGGPDQNLILLDGTPVYHPNHLLGFLSTFNPAVVRDVQLVKGGFPARYGGRLSSVVDLNTREGNRKEYRAEGTVGLVYSSLAAEGPLFDGRSSFLVSARRTYIDVLARPFLNRRLEEGQDLVSYFYDTNARLNYMFSQRSRVSLSLYLGRDIYGSTLETRDEVASSGILERHTAGTKWGNVVSTLRWNHLFSDKLFGNVTLNFSRFRFDVTTGLTTIEEGPPPVESTEEITYRSGISDWAGAIDFDYRPVRRHFIRFGAHLTRHGLNPGVSTLKLHTTDDVGSGEVLNPYSFPYSGVEGFVYVEDDVSIGWAWRANLGIHASGMRVRGRTYTSVQPRIALRYLLRPSWSLKASFSTMQQYLHLLSSTGLNLPTDLWVAATDRIGPQRAWQAAVGTSISGQGGRYDLQMEGYYKSMQGLLEYEAGAAFVTLDRDWQDKVEVGEGWSYGVEVLLRKRLGRTSGWIGYTLSWTRRKFDDLNQGAPFPYRYDRRHDLSVVVSHQLSNRFDVGATWVYGTGQAVTLSAARYRGDRHIDDDLLGDEPSQSELRYYGPRGGFRMAPYHRLDLALNWHFGKVLFFGSGKSTLSVGAYNVYNRKNPFYLFESRTAAGRRVYKQASLFPIIPFFSYRFEF